MPAGDVGGKPAKPGVSGGDSPGFGAALNGDSPGFGPGPGSGLGGKLRIGVLALQGDFDAHRRALEEAGAQAVSVRSEGELAAVDGLIIPGGESTTMLKLLTVEKLFEPLRQFGQQKPIFGTCAGAILLASEVRNPQQASLGLMDLTVERNGYGRQVDSRIATLDVNGHAAEAVFIRAPIIRRVGPGTTVLATYQNDPVLAQEGLHLVATFHPELSVGSSVHAHFVKMVEEAKLTGSAARADRKSD